MRLDVACRAVLGRGAQWCGLLAMAERRMSRRLTVLAYHRVLPEEECRDYPLASLVTPAPAFREQVRWLAAHCDVLPLSRAMERWETRGESVGRPIVVLTFDDGYADNAAAARTLEEFGVRGTFFITTGFVGTSSLLWFDRAGLAWEDAPPMARAEACLRLGGRMFTHARQWVQGLKTCEPAVREALIAELERVAPSTPQRRRRFTAMSCEQVCELSRRGHEIGSHTVSHPMLPQMKDGALWAELHDSRCFLRQLVNEDVRAIAYPNGDHDQRVVQMAAAAGYRLGCTTAPGLNHRRGDPLCLRRIDPSSRHAFRAASDPVAFRMKLALKAIAADRRRARSSNGRGVAYLNTQYPSLSHTFIDREVRAVREQGMRVVPLSVRPAAGWDRFGAGHARAARETVALLDHRGRLALRAALQVAAHPVRAVRSLLLSQQLSPPGIGARMRQLAYWVEGARLAREMRDAGLNHVHVHMANNGAMVAILACAHEPAMRYSLTIHGSAEFFHVDSWGLAPKAERAMFVRCISDFCRAQVMTWTDPAVWGRFHVVRCGVDPGRPPWKLRRQRQAGDGAFRIVTVGRLHPIKGLSVLLRSCGRLDDCGVEWFLDVLGDGPERAPLEALARRLGIDERIRFHGAVAAENVARHYDGADVMVLSSFMEGVPVVLMEAMSRGLPVVATQVGGVAELVEQGVSGLLVAPGSESQLAAALIELAGDEARRARMGRAGRRRVMHDYNRRTLGASMVELFRRYEPMASPVESPARDLDPAAPFTPSLRLTHANGKGTTMNGTRRRPSYVVISPCRDEAAHVRETLASVIAQSVRPGLWVIVDDGSTDGTTKILEDYAARYEFIEVLRIEDRGRRSVGPGVIEAFNAGLEQVHLEDFEYLCKLDLDLRLPPRYFETLIDRMEADRRLGTCSGKPYFVDGRGQLVSETVGDEMSAGMTKFYRAACFRQIGGFVRAVMWDGIDCHRCRMLGWKARSWDEPELRFLHLRPMGSSQKSIWSGRARHGYGQWFMGTSLPYITASAALRLSSPPRILGSLAMWCGYVSSMIRGLPRYPDSEFRRFLRRFQRQALVRGKARATRNIERDMAPRWRAPDATPRPPRESGDLPMARKAFEPHPCDTAETG